MFVLGIDPGLSTTGYGIVERVAGGARAVAAGVIRTETKAPIADRLVELHRDLVEIISEHSIESAAIEQVFVNKNLQTATSVARASGVALLAMASAGLEVAEYTPSQVKAALAGYGTATKEQMQWVVMHRLGLEAAPRPADAADALAIALCHLQLSKTAGRIASGA